MTRHHPFATFETAATPVSPSLARRTILGLPLVDATTEQTVEHVLSGSVRSVFFLNAHCANVRAGDRGYAAALGRADLILPDGIGVELAARMSGAGLTQNLNGTDFTPALLAEAARRGLSVFLFGATPGTADKAAKKLVTTIPGLRVAGTLDGYDGAADEDAAVARINASGADILLVAMGVPRQEIWIDRHLPGLSPRVVLGVGALFDFLAGNVTRAPRLVRVARMEWIWRLAQEPRRLAKRYLLGNAAFWVALPSMRCGWPARKRLASDASTWSRVAWLYWLFRPYCSVSRLLSGSTARGPPFSSRRASVATGLFLPSTSSAQCIPMPRNDWPQYGCSPIARVSASSRATIRV